ncbi:hypothetical protein KCP70_08195 [Salmonella enterica subsp. enterica]|nr:hypothetical protein KCP70_08195 [Salmonella enterica subsp. enterica]
MTAPEISRSRSDAVGHCPQRRAQAICFAPDVPCKRMLLITHRRRWRKNA